MSIGHRSKCGMIDGCPVSRIGGRMRKESRYAQDGIAQVDKTRCEQPEWFARPATTAPRLEEEYRYHQVWQVNAEEDFANGLLCPHDHYIP